LHGFKSTKTNTPFSKGIGIKYFFLNFFILVNCIVPDFKIMVVPLSCNSSRKHQSVLSGVTLPTPHTDPEEERVSTT
jgi:hypothetical protein